MASTTFVDGETLIEAAWLNDVNAAVYTPGTVTAADIANVPAGNIAATNVQTALNELDTEKQPLDNELTALATSTAAANKIPYFTGTTTAGTLDWNSATALAASTTTISSNTVVKTAIDDLIVNCTAATPDKSADYIVFEDATDSTQKKALASTLGATSGTAQATTSGTTIDFTSIPSWVKRITVMFSGVSTSGTSALQVQLGDSGGIETTGYLSGTVQAATSAAVALTTIASGFYVGVPTAPTALFRGIGTLVLLDATTNTWCWSANVSDSANDRDFLSAGDKALTATLDRIRITAVNGTDTFDAGTINILYE